jgi:uncharacterized damage-inducible protein DinB
MEHVMASASPTRRAAPGAAVRQFEALAALLDGLATLVLQTPCDAYVAQPVPGVSGSIGAQVRHTLDHVAAFLSSARTSALSYDHRDRGTDVERDPAAALRTIFRLKTALLDSRVETLDAPVQVVTQVAPDEEAVSVWSSRARELAFVQSHTIHHQAIIALLLVMQGLMPPAGLGYAPSTPRG